MYEELVKRLRGVQKYTAGSITNMLAEAADAIEEQQAQIDGWIEQERTALLKSIPKWIPVAKRKPENNTDVLAYYDDAEESRIIPVCYGYGLWYDQIFNCSIDDAKVTHWMPLPQPPKEEEA